MTVDPVPRTMEEVLKRLQKRVLLLERRRLARRGGGGWTPYVNVLNRGVVGDGIASDAAAIQSIIDTTTNEVIYFPTGTYRLEATLLLRRNGVRIYAEPDALFQRYHDSSIFLNGNVGQSTQPYGDMHIEGGVWDMRGLDNNNGGCVVSFGKCDVFTLRNMVMKNQFKTHNIELEGSSNGLIENVVHSGFHNPGNTHYYAEAVQLGQITAAGFPLFNIDDKTPSNNIVIRNMRQIEPDAGYVRFPCMIGNHSAPVTGTTAPHRITIEDCDFGECTYKVIRPWGWKDTQIRNVKGSGPIGIEVDCAGSLLNLIIDASDITATTGDGRGVVIMNGSGVTIRDCRITASDRGVWAGNGAIDVNVLGCRITSSFDGVAVRSDASGSSPNRSIRVENNHISATRYPIMTYNNSNGATHACTFRGNTVTGGEAGISLVGDWNSVVDNIVWSCSGSTAILAPSGSDGNVIIGNRVPSGKTVTNAGGLNQVANNVVM